MSPFWGRIWNARKAIVAAVGAGWTAFAAIVASLPAGEGISAITLSGWMLVVSAVLGTTGFVYTLPNKPLPTVTYAPVPDTITLPDYSDAPTGDTGGPVSPPDLSVDVAPDLVDPTDAVQALVGAAPAHLTDPTNAVRALVKAANGRVIT